MVNTTRSLSTRQRSSTVRSTSCTPTRNLRNSTRQMQDTRYSSRIWMRVWTSHCGACTIMGSVPAYQHRPVRRSMAPAMSTSTTTVRRRSGSSTTSLFCNSKWEVWLFLSRTTYCVITLFRRILLSGDLWYWCCFVWGWSSWLWCIRRRGRWAVRGSRSTIGLWLRSGCWLGSGVCWPRLHKMCSLPLQRS